MKFVYLTAKAYPASTADHIYVRELARGFHSILGKDFTLIVANNHGEDLQGIPVLNLHLSLRRFRTVYYFLWLRRFIFSGHRNNDTIFFSNDPNLLAVLTFWKKTLHLRYKICSDWHMLFGGWCDRYIMRGSDQLVTTSEKLRNAIMRASGVGKEKILVAYGGIDLNVYKSIPKDDARDTLHLPKDKKIVSYIGRFKTMGMEKGIRTMIDALVELPEEMVMLFVGGGIYEISEYKEYAQTKGVANRCIFVEQKSQHELAIYQAASDILAIPYPDKPHFRDFGFPMKVYEYMTSNRPIVYSKLDLAEEILAPYARGFIADNANDFSRALMEMFGEYALWEEKAALAAKAVQGYSWENKARTILQSLST
jgi:glycosyltransferase involved in cell wall biosynthesis